MKTLIAALVLTVAAAAQNTSTMMHSADSVNTPAPQGVAVSSAAGSSPNGSASSLRDPMVPVGSGASFGEISGDKKPKKPVVVPDSLQGSTTGDANQNAGINKLHVDTANAATQPVGLHFTDLVDGIDAVSVTVRKFQMFCNTHSMQQDETEVRQWVAANQNIVASSPSEMLRKKQYPEVRDQLVGLKFPKEWFEPAAASASAAK